jgi:hypothetical protein
MNIFRNLIAIDKFLQIWLKSDKLMDNIKCIFTFDTSNLTELHILYQNNKKKFINSSLIRSTMIEIYDSYNNNFAEDNLSSKIYVNFIKFVLSKTNIKKNENALSKIIFDEYYKIHKEQSYVFGYNVNINQMFVNNFYFNLLSLFIEDITDNIQNYSPNMFFNRKDKNSLYKDELGVGGTISHVWKEYGLKIDYSLKDTNDTCDNFLFHKILKITYSYIVSVMKEIVREFGSLRMDSIDTSVFPKMENFRNIAAIFTLKNKSVNII